MDYSTERELKKMELAKFADRIDEWVLDQIDIYGSFRVIKRVYGLEEATLASVKLDEQNIRRRRRSA